MAVATASEIPGPFAFLGCLRDGVKIKIKVKGNGKECPFHTGRRFAPLTAEAAVFTWAVATVVAAVVRG